MMHTPMPTSQPTPTSSNVTNVEGTISDAMLAYFRARLSNRIHELVLSEFAEQERDGKTSRADLARRIRRKPEQITRWLGSPGNWTIETLSDLLLGMGLEPSLSLRSLDRQKKLPNSEGGHISNMTKIFRSWIDVQTSQEVARDIKNGNHKPFYLSVNMPVEYMSTASTTQSRQALPVRAPNLLNIFEEQVHVVK